MNKLLPILIALILTGCASSTTPALYTELIGPRWAQDKKVVTQDYPGTGMTLNVTYETYYLFDQSKITKEVVCHFSNPIQKTIIVSATAPVKYSDGRLWIQESQYQKQEYKQILVPVSGVGPKKERIVYCNSELKQSEYKFSLRADQLTLDPVEELIVLNRFKGK